MHLQRHQSYPSLAFLGSGIASRTNVNEGKVNTGPELNALSWEVMDIIQHAHLQGFSPTA